ncbi:MAG: hypothetical protein AAF998_06855 [Bacteroidota bacterium]
MKWKRRPCEQPGDYTFSGKLYITRGIIDALPEEDIAEIVEDLRRVIREKGMVDYLQVYLNQVGGLPGKVWWIDNLSESRKRSRELSPAQIQDYDYSTILLPEEY